MTTRRHFLRTLAIVPPALAFSPVLAADASRVALVIGNSKYAQSPLANPANDARDFGSLLDNAGFSVERHLDLGRQNMVAAIERFGKAVARPDTKLAVFYYAGHGVQLDWRNYLLPVDANVDTAEQLKQRCVDLGLLLGTLSAHKEKTFVIILDACRDDPFAGTYRPVQKGLSQFDAPVGSLLAYATSPGNVASDGSGKNGLYTENLLRELSQRGTRIEDALKRVRLNVRLGSKGAQVPWETTSLESDVYIFSDGDKKISEAEIEAQLDADIAEWSRIKQSRDIEDWIGYLRRFPNGRFAEIAQMRLSRLLADIEKAASQERAKQEEEAKRKEQERLQAEQVRLAEAQRVAAENRLISEQDRQKREKQYRDTNAQLRRDKERTDDGERAEHSQSAAVRERISDGRATDQVTVTKALPSQPPPRPSVNQPPIEIHAGTPVPVFIAPSANPYSAGRFALGRIFSVGDEATFRQSDLLTGVEERIYSPRVTRVDHEHDRVEFNRGNTITDLMGNTIKAGSVEFDTPVQFTPAEFQVGRKWTAAFRRIQNGKTTSAYYDLHIVRREMVEVPAGRFDAFRIEGNGWNMTNSTKLETTYWLVPGLVFGIKREVRNRNRFGRFVQTELHELISLRQQVIGTTVG